MKVRIGVSSGTGNLTAAEMGALADAVAGLGFDSLWLPEILTQPAHDPFTALAWVAGRNPGLKIGTTALVPGRNLVRLAKQVATVDQLSGGRFLLTLVPGIARDPERGAVGVPPQERGAVMEDALPVLRRLWAGESVGHDGPAGSFPEMTLSPLPAQHPFEVWLGGMAPASLERCGRLSDGWLPALCTPAEAKDGRAVVEAAAERAGRTISPEHFGVSLAYATGQPDDRVVAALAARARGNDIADLLPVGLDALRHRINEFVEVGFSKFVVRPVSPSRSWPEELEDLAASVVGLQT